ncbi:MAG TPA: SAM-dependent methyltransferase, partial [Vicinamibacterales bacterium]|nr:SAM-dependent methyltransferase [Vicinamibacterales bacterium]
MDLALYDPHVGYYARAAQRSGRAGDFFTSVDVGPIFGELLEAQIAEMAALLESVESVESVESLESQIPNPKSRLDHFDLVEAGAGNGRLAADILRAVKQRDPALYARLRLHLVEASADARAAQAATLGDTAERLVSSSTALPEQFEGVLIANELLDAFPVHQVVMREHGLREVYVDVGDDGRASTVEKQGWSSVSSVVERCGMNRAASEGESFVLVEGPPSTPALQTYLARLGVTLGAGCRAEINLRAVDWIRDAAQRLTRGFIVLIDYGHDARQLYSASHADGTLTTFSRHTMAGPEKGPYPFSTPPWLQRPGEQDITAHVDFTSVRAAAGSEGLATLLFLDQTYFVMGMLNSSAPLQSLGST